MASAFFQSLEAAGAPITATDADPNTTAPADSRVLKQTQEAGFAGSLRGTRDIHLYATFIAGTTPSFDGQVWIKDAAGSWLAFGAAITTLNLTLQTVADVPAGVDVFFQVTAINGAPTSGIPRLLAA
jgi:hypothetical protein